MQYSEQARRPSLRHFVSNVTKDHTIPITFQSGVVPRSLQPLALSSLGVPFNQVLHHGDELNIVNEEKLIFVEEWVSHHYGLCSLIEHVQAYRQEHPLLKILIVCLTRTCVDAVVHVLTRILDEDIALSYRGDARFYKEWKETQGVHVCVSTIVTLRGLTCLWLFAAIAFEGCYSTMQILNLFSVFNM